MKNKNLLKIVTAIAAAAVVSCSCALSVTDANASGTEDLHVLWIQDYHNNGEIAGFSIKTTAKNTQVRDDFQSDSLDYVTVNGYTLTEILLADATASVRLDGAFLQVTVSAEGYAYCLEETENDRIVIEKGFSFISGEVTPYDFSYTYDAVFEKYMVIPDPSLIDESRITSALLRDVVFDTTNERQLFVHFSYPVCLEYISCVQYDSESMAEQFRNIGWSDPNDLYISQLSLFGIRDSILNNVLVDDKSLAEWMEYDGAYVADPESLVRIAFHGTGRDRGRYMTIEFGYASSCVLSNNESHKLTLKKGLIFPTLARLNRDVTLVYDPETDIWGSEHPETPIYSGDVQAGEESCASALTGTGAVVFSMGAILACAWIKGRKKKGDLCDEK